MKISHAPNPILSTIRSGLVKSKGPNPNGPQDQLQPSRRELKEMSFRHVASAMASGAGVGAVAGAATGLMGALPGVPTGLATGLTTSAGLITGAWLGLAIGYVGC